MEQNFLKEFPKVIRSSCKHSPSLFFRSHSIKTSLPILIPAHNFVTFLCAPSHCTPACNLCDIPAYQLGTGVKVRKVSLKGIY